MSPEKILIVAGEASGDLHGAHLMEALQSLRPRIVFYGVGGEKMEQRGMRVLYPAQALSVVGITEVLLRAGSLLKALRILRSFLDREKPTLVLLIDFPDFNFRVARMAYRRGIPVVYYISPQVWAWRAGRVRQLARWVRKMIVLFPFEVPLYERAGVDVSWVGHPLLDLVRPAFTKEEGYRRFGLDPGKLTVGLLPGSRFHEVRRLLPNLLVAATLMKKELPRLQFILPRASGIPEEMIEREVDGGAVPVKVVKDHPYEVMNVCDLLITASGTATLEGAILGKPMVIVYRVSRLSYWIGKALIRVDHIGLVNLVSGRRVAPELIQDEASPERIAAESLRILRDPFLYQEISEAMAKVREALGSPGAAMRAGRIVCELMSHVPGAPTKHENL